MPQAVIIAIEVETEAESLGMGQILRQCRLPVAKLAADQAQPEAPPYKRSSQGQIKFNPSQSHDQRPVGDTPHPGLASDPQLCRSERLAKYNQLVSRGVRVSDGVSWC
mmetsp:Transcript_27497/g.63588  ORF Transcript_27497/g.63588 Transcript_27497/m.63588 type:complete len:108 (-) Transcript_27497:105-428(-)